MGTCSNDKSFVWERALHRGDMTGLAGNCAVAGTLCLLRFGMPGVLQLFRTFTYHSNPELRSAQFLFQPFS